MIHLAGLVFYVLMQERVAWRRFVLFPDCFLPVAWDRWPGQAPIFDDLDFRPVVMQNVPDPVLRRSGLSRNLTNNHSNCMVEQAHPKSQ